MKVPLHRRAGRVELFFGKWKNFRGKSSAGAEAIP
jgi:hypothetical protein